MRIPFDNRFLKTLSQTFSHAAFSLGLGTGDIEI